MTDPEKINPPEPSQREEVKPFLEHLEDLRLTLIWGFAALALGMIIAFPFVPQILGILKIPLENAAGHTERILRSLEVSGAFMVSLRIAFWSGLLMSAPFLFLIIGRFIFPGLTGKEKNVVKRAAGFAVLLFICGALLAFYVTLPVALKVMFGLHDWIGVQPEWTVSSYVAFSTQMLIGFGLVFEMPVIVLILGKLGIVNSDMLREKRRFAILISVIVGAVLTPGPDVFSQLVMAIPLILLYEICIWLLRIKPNQVST